MNQGNRPKKEAVNTRELVTDMLMEIDKTKEYSHILLRNVLEKYNYLDECDKAFMKRILDGTLERRIEIDYVLNQISKVPVNKMKPFIRSLMRMSTYQILYMDKIPDRAVCDEAVKLAAKRKFSQLKGFINGVLRNLVRQKETLVYPDEKKNPIESISIRYSMPQFIVENLAKDYGIEKTKKVVEGLLEERNLCVRIKESILEKQKEAVKKEWQEKGIIATKHPYLDYAYCLKNTDSLSSLKGFREGWFTIQDVSSMLVCEIADIKSDYMVMDVCAAPGGKSLHVADKLNGSGDVLSRDVSDYKASLIRDNVKRMQEKNVTVEVYDATIHDNTKEQYADVVIADVPCSGIGVIGKKPDIKYNLTEETLDGLREIQMQIMDAVWNYVKVGGTLIYSTCTIRKEENEDMVEYLEKKYPLKRCSITEYLPKELQSKTTDNGYLQLFPFGLTDGFFMAKFRRIK